MSPITKPELAEFLKQYVALNFNFSAAARAIKRSPRALYARLDADPEFAQAFADTKRVLGDVLLAEAVRRAVEGVEKPIYQGGKRVGTVREFSDSLLLASLRALRPEFKERSALELSGPNGAPIQLVKAELDRRIAARISQIASRNAFVIDVTPELPALEHDDVSDLV